MGKPDVERASGTLAALSFAPRGDLGIPDRYAFAAPERYAPTNTYVVLEGSLQLRNHLAVRDTLRADPELRRAYAEVKRRAASVAEDIDEYIRLKSDVLQRILARGGLMKEERAAIDQINRAATEPGRSG